MFGERFKKLRINKGLCQVEIAKVFGVTKQCVSNWENENIMPSVDMLVKIAKFFNVSTDYLLGLSEEHALNTEGLSDIGLFLRNIVFDFYRFTLGQKTGKNAHFVSPFDYGYIIHSFILMAI